MTLKLLLAGKEIANFQAIKDAFNNEDATIITATSMALALFLARKNQPDLIIAQEQLTDSDGLSLFYELKNEDELTKIPFALFLIGKQNKNDQVNVSINSSFEKRTEFNDIHVISLADINYAPQDVFSLKEKILALLPD